MNFKAHLMCGVTCETRKINPRSQKADSQFEIKQSKTKKLLLFGSESLTPLCLGCDFEIIHGVNGHSPAVTLWG